MRNSILSLFAIAMCSCAENYKTELTEPANAVASDLSENVRPGAELISNPAAKLIKTADYSFRTDDLKRCTEAIENHVSRFPAHISSSNLSRSGSTLENIMTIRVQSEFFNDLLKEIDREAVHIQFRNIRTEDVAKQFVDVESRLKTKREVQERYKEILRTKAGKIEELLSAERQIGELQEEIEASVSKLNYLKEQVAYSTINLEFYQSVTTENLAEIDEPLGKKFGDAFSSGLDGTLSILVGLTALWPLLLLSAITIVILKRRRFFFIQKQNTI